MSMNEAFEPGATFPVTAFARQNKDLTTEEIRERYGDAFLVLGHVQDLYDGDPTSALDTVAPGGRGRDLGRSVGEMTLYLLAPPGTRAEDGTRPDVVVGRTGGGGIALTHNLISKRHARFAYDADAGTFTLTDLGSTNGTQINGETIPADEPLQLRGRESLDLGGAFYGFFRTAETLKTLLTAVLYI